MEKQESQQEPMQKKKPIEETSLPTGTIKLDEKDKLLTGTIIPQDLTLEKFIVEYPNLRDKLIEALETQQFFITISFQKKLKPEDEHDLQHFWLLVGYNRNDVLPTLQHIRSDFTAKEMPTAELPDDKEWH